MKSCFFFFTTSSVLGRVVLPGRVKIPIMVKMAPEINPANPITQLVSSVFFAIGNAHRKVITGTTIPAPR